MDTAVLTAYGWQEIALAHNFYEVDYLPENDRIRFTISPQARKEVLKRLLQLNHARAAAGKRFNHTACVRRKHCPVVKINRLNPTGI